MFYQDGSAKSYTRNSFYLEKEGKWSFNINTDILATTIDGWQWQVTLVDSDDWAGLALGSASTQLFSRAPFGIEVAQILANNHWVNTKDSKLEFETESLFTDYSYAYLSSRLVYLISCDGQLKTADNKYEDTSSYMEILVNDITDFSFDYRMMFHRSNGSTLNGYMVDSSLYN